MTSRAVSAILDHGGENASKDGGNVKTTIAILALLAAAASVETRRAHAASATGTHTECSRRASERGLTDESRERFIAECRESMRSKAHTRSCSKRADEQSLHGEARRQYLIDCLKTQGRGSRSGRGTPGGDAKAAPDASTPRQATRK